METDNPPKLLLHAEKLLPHPVHPHLIACCPTMDLVAVINQEEQLNVYRFGGQRAFGLQRRSGEGKVVSLGWKFNGQYLAVGWSDGIVEVVSAETGNVLQHFRQPSLSGKAKNESNTSSGVTCIGWGLNFIEVGSVRRRTDANDTNGATPSSPFEGLASEDWIQRRDSASLDDFLERIPDLAKIDIPLDLPEQLARFDVSSSMVKLPALPLLPPHAYKQGEHPAAELFASQISMDAALYSNSAQKVNALEALLLAQGNGKVRLILYDALSIGEVPLPTDWQVSKVDMRKCVSHPFSSTYMFLVELPLANGQKKIALLPLSLRFLHSSGSQIHIIESKTAQLEILVQYVGESLLALHHHWKHAQELPAKFMAGINDDLAEKGEPSLVQSLFHLAATGDCPPTLKEWLVDILAERGHKRWDHSITHGYTKVLELTHENLLPTIDRCVAILSHLRGLAIYHEHSPVFNVPSAIFDTILNLIRCIRLLAHHVLLFCSEETQQFTEFSKWLRHEIDVQASETPPDPAEEAAQDPNIDYALLLAYIQGALVISRVSPFVKQEQDLPPTTASASMYEDLRKALNNFKLKDDTSEELINLSTYFDEWVRHNRTLVDQITSHQRTSSSITSGIVLEEGDMLISDMRMLREKRIIGVQSEIEEPMSTITAVVLKNTPSQVNITKIVHSADFEGPKSIRTTLSGTMLLPPDTLVLDLKFVDDDRMMLIVKQKDYHYLISIPYAEKTESFLGAGRDQKLCQVPGGQPINVGDRAYRVSGLEIEQWTKHTFKPDDRLKPARIEVNGRKNRRLVVVLGEDNRQMRIFDLDYREGDVAHHRQSELATNERKDKDDDETMLD